MLLRTLHVVIITMICSYLASSEFSIFPAAYTGCPANPPSIYLLKVNNRKTRTRWEICSKLTIKTPERRPYFTPCSSVSIINFGHVIAGWKKHIQLKMLIFDKKWNKFKQNFHGCNILSLSSLRSINWLNILGHYLVLI